MCADDDFHPVGESATCPIARLASRLAALLLLAGAEAGFRGACAAPPEPVGCANPAVEDHAASSRLARRLARRTLEHVQLRFLG